MNQILRFVSIGILIFISCNRTNKSANTNDIIVLGHTYEWGQHGNKIDPRLEKYDYSTFSQVWLLGDICGATIREPETLDYLDKIFDLSSSKTKLSVGNHDLNYGNPSLIEEATKRPLNYGVIENSLAIYVLNTQIHHEVFKNNCDLREKQKKEFEFFLNQVLKSNEVKNLFILSHNTVWSNLEMPLKEYQLIGNANSSWIDFKCENNSRFHTLFKEVLFTIQSSGKQITFVSGDGGQYQKTFFEKGESGIRYYVTGINNSVLVNGDKQTIEKFNTASDSILIFKYDSIVQSYNGMFVPLN